MKGIRSNIIFLTVFFFSLKCFSQDQVKELDLDLDNYEYPFEVHFHQFDAQQQRLKMAYIWEKPDNFNGKTIVLLHGKNFNSAYWETTIEALTKNGFEVIAPDQVGFGKSTKPAYFQYTFQQLAENTKNLLDSLQIEKASVLGHSMGGMLATRFTLMYPNFTENLILVNPIGLEDWKLKIPYQSVDDWFEQELKKDYDAIKNYQKENYYDGDWNDEYANWAKLLAGWTLNSEYPLIAWNAALTYDMILTQPVVYEFEEIKAPSLLIIGTRDRTALGKGLVSEEIRATMGRYNKLGKKTKDRIPNAELVELKDVGHLPQIESFDAFIAPLLDYLLK